MFEYLPKDLKYITRGECILTMSHGRKSVDGDIRAFIKFNGKMQPASRVVFFMENGYCPPVVRHTCDRPRCINPFHLCPGTHADNVRDRVERNRSASGENNGRAKLTDGQVKEIRLLRGKHTISWFSKKYDVDRRVIRLILENKIWRSV